MEVLSSKMIEAKCEECGNPCLVEADMMLCQMSGETCMRSSYPICENCLKDLERKPTGDKTMNPDRLTAKELNDFKPTYESPFITSCDDGAFENELKVIKIITPVISGRVVFINENCEIRHAESDILHHYPSKIERLRTIELWENIRLVPMGITQWLTEDGYSFNHEEQRKVTKINRVARTGRKITVSLETGEVIGDMIDGDKRSSPLPVSSDGVST